MAKKMEFFPFLPRAMSGRIITFSNVLCEKGVLGSTKPSIRFLGIWDTVPSFGIPGNKINLGYDFTVRHHVKMCCHAIALDERRFTFPLDRVAEDDALAARAERNIREVWFRGFHSDVGGGNENEELSSISLVWMFKRAQDCNIDIPTSYIDKHAVLRNPSGDCCKPPMDLKANKKRIILDTDVVHESVSSRETAGKFSANNPPKGLRVIGDDGKIRETRFA